VAVVVEKTMWTVKLTDRNPMRHDGAEFPTRKPEVQMNAGGSIVKDGGQRESRSSAIA
jgi:hypothetical protein